MSNKINIHAYASTHTLERITPNLKKLIETYPDEVLALYEGGLRQGAIKTGLGTICVFVAGCAIKFILQEYNVIK